MSRELEVKHYKVLSLSSNLDKNAVYYLFDQNTGKVKAYITTKDGIPIPLIDLTTIGSVLSVTGTGVSGTAQNPKVDIATFVSSQLGNQVYLSLSDGKLQVNPITSPDNSIEVTSTSSELQIQLSAAIQTQINTALQPGANISELTNDAGYLTLADIDATDLSYAPSATNGTVNSSTGTDAIIPLAGALKADITYVNSQDASTLASANAYSDSLVVGLWDDRGTYDASVNLYPSTGGSGTAGAILKGDIWTISVEGVIDGYSIKTRQTVRALIDSPGQTSSNWAIGLADPNISDSIVDGVVSVAPSQNAVYDALQLKQDRTSTTLISGCSFVNNGTTFSINPGVFQIVDNSTTPYTKTDVNFLGITNVTPLYFRTVLYINSSGTVVQVNGATGCETWHS